MGAGGGVGRLGGGGGGRGGGGGGIGVGEICLGAEVVLGGKEAL